MKTVTKDKNIKPIQLLRFDGEKRLSITEEAIQLFEDMQVDQMCVVTVAGKYRTGKSYILNRVLLEQNGGFQVGSTINACTKGLWVWPKLVPIKVGDEIKNSLIIDTEGLGSLEEGENTDMKIFLMALLLSSYFIYNSVGSIDEKALESLSLVTHLAQLLCKNGSSYDSQELINSFPAFMWLVRDFSLRLENQNGEPITSQQYLQNALRYQKVKGNGSERKNQIRKHLKTFFTNRNCFTLIRPTENERDLQNLSTLPEYKLRPQFVKLITKFKQTIRSSIKPKKIRGKSLTPQGFIQLCKYFTDTLNSGQLPSINSHWDNLCIKEAGRIIEHYRQNHYSVLKDYLQQETSTHDKVKKLEEVHKSILKQASEKIDKSFLGKLQKQLSKERLEKVLTQIYQTLLAQLNEKQFVRVKQIVKQIFSQIVIQFKQNKLESFEQVFERFQQIKERYKNEQRIYQSFYENSKDVFHQFLRNLQNDWQKEQLILLEKNEYLETVMERKTEEMRESLTSSSSHIRALEQKTYKYELENQQLNEKNQQLMKSIQKLIKQNEEFDMKCYELQEELANRKMEQFQELVKIKNEELEEKSSETQYLRIQLAKQEEVVRDLTIKERKLQREMEIFKNKCSEYLKQNINLNDNLQKLNKKIYGMQQDQRKIEMNSLQCSLDVPDMITSQNKKIDELQFQLKIKQQEVKTISKTLHNQKITNQTLLKTPQNMNFLALKKSYQLQKETNQKLNRKLKEFQLVHTLCSYRCSLCKKNVEKDRILIHIQNCCQSKLIYFDVSYHYNGNGELQFLIDINIDESEWSVRKSLNSIKLFLHKYKINSKLFEKGSQKEDDLNCKEDQRVFLDELFNSYKKSIWDDGYLVEFFAIDIHLLNQKTEKTNSSMRGSKISLDLDDLLQQNIEPSINLTKTTKFNRKIFKFGPEM